VDPTLPELAFDASPLTSINVPITLVSNYPVTVTVTVTQGFSTCRYGEPGCLAGGQPVTGL
jgi:hypothetical protein